jgi:adenine-specific DNA methylase
MKRLDAAGRIVDPYALFFKALKKASKAAGEYAEAVSDELSDPLYLVADATTLTIDGKVDVIITSPPYQNAVDYYRRHLLEMYWLGLTRTREERLALLPQYIGKHRVPASHPAFNHSWSPSPIAQDWLGRMEKVSPPRAQDFSAYMISMNRVFDRWAELLPRGGQAVCVVGRSTWQGADIPTEALFVELAHGRFTLSEHLTYPVRNRYMSYTRRNGASIDEEHVLVLTRD